MYASAGYLGQMLQLLMKIQRKETSSVDSQGTAAASTFICASNQVGDECLVLVAEEEEEGINKVGGTEGSKTAGRAASRRVAAIRKRHDLENPTLRRPCVG